MFGLDILTKQRLLPLYLETDYHIPDLKTSLSIGQRNPEVDLWLAKHHANHAVFITAFNPNSEVLSTAMNHKRNLELAMQLDSFSYLKGRGIPQNTGWIPEDSFLVMELPEDLTLDLMKQFGQLAVVWHQYSQPSRLLWIDESSGI